MAQWSGFKNLETFTFILKPDWMKNETFIVPSRSHFSAFAISIFTLVEVAPQFLVLKMSHNLSKSEKIGKLREQDRLKMVSASILKEASRN